MNTEFLIVLAFAIGYITREWSASKEADRLNGENATLREWLRLKTGYTMPSEAARPTPAQASDDDAKPNPLMKPPKWNNTDIGKPPDLLKDQARAKLADSADVKAGKKPSSYV